jgi:hypothetical protein
MAVVESPDLRQTTLTLRSEQIVLIDRLKALLQEVNPGRIVYRSDVVRLALDRGLPHLREALEGGETVALDGGA